jgi:hypothetical protein
VKISNKKKSFFSTRNQYFPHIPYVASKKMADFYGKYLNKKYYLREKKNLFKINCHTNFRFSKQFSYKQRFASWTDIIWAHFLVKSLCMSVTYFSAGIASKELGSFEQRSVAIWCTKVRSRPKWLNHRATDWLLPQKCWVRFSSNEAKHV